MVVRSKCLIETVPTGKVELLCSQKASVVPSEKLSELVCRYDALREQGDFWSREAITSSIAIRI